MTRPEREFSIDQLRQRRNVKWRKFPGEVLPAWIADMDLPIAPPVREALERICADQDCGYPYREGSAEGFAVTRSFAARAGRRFDWPVEAAEVQACSDLIQAGVAAILAYSDPGDGVIIQVPAYPPFHSSITSTGRKILANPMVAGATGYQIDLAGLEALAARPESKVLLFCNPHNPTGRAFTRAELDEVGRIAVRHDLVIVSDEIHADLVYPPHERHLPMAMVSPEVAARTVTLFSATKSFNIAGLRCGVIHFGAPELQRRFAARIPRQLLGIPGITGIDATVAAWDRCDDWLDACVVHLQARRDQLARRLAQELPEVRMFLPEATYLAWLDFSALDLGCAPSAFLFEEAAVAVSDGRDFGADWGNFARLNFATSEAILDQLIDRIVAAVRKRGTPKGEVAA